METITRRSDYISNGTRFTDSVFGGVNPIVLSGTQWVSGYPVHTGSTFHHEVVSYQSDS